MIFCLKAYISKFDLFFSCKWLASKCFGYNSVDKEAGENPKLALKKVKAIANKEIKNMVFRRQVVYFIILLVTETPSVLFFFYMGYISKVAETSELLEILAKAAPFRSFTQVFFTMRAIVIPILIFLEPVKFGVIFNKFCL